MTRKVWASKGAVKAEIADVPDNWLRGFAVRHPEDCRKFHQSRNGSLLYRVAAVLKAIEDGESMPDDGIVRRGETDAELALRAQDSDDADGEAWHGETDLPTTGKTRRRPPTGTAKHEEARSR